MTAQLVLSTPVVSIHNGKAVTTSQDVANYFGKLHKNVIAKIESIECSPDFTKLNFKLSEYTDSTGRTLPMYEMTKNGFTFLVMGFTGKRAAQFKEAYIAEFDRMEAELNGIDKLPQDPIQQPISVTIPHRGRWLVSYDKFDGTVRVINIDGNNIVDGQCFQQLQRDAIFMTKAMQQFATRLRITHGECSKSLFDEPLRLSIK